MHRGEEDDAQHRRPARQRLRGPVQERPAQGGDRQGGQVAQAEQVGHRVRWRRRDEGGVERDGARVEQEHAPEHQGQHQRRPPPPVQRHPSAQVSHAAPLSVRSVPVHAPKLAPVRRTPAAQRVMEGSCPDP